MSQIDDVILGLSILREFDTSVRAEHDMIYAGPNDASVVPSLTEAILRDKGWEIDPVSGCWARSL